MHPIIYILATLVGIGILVYIMMKKTDSEGDGNGGNGNIWTSSQLAEHRQKLEQKYNGLSADEHTCLLNNLAANYTYDELKDMEHDPAVVIGECVHSTDVDGNKKLSDTFINMVAPVQKTSCWECAITGIEPAELIKSPLSHDTFNKIADRLISCGTCNNDVNFNQNGELNQAFDMSYRRVKILTNEDFATVTANATNLEAFKNNVKKLINQVTGHPADKVLTSVLRQDGKVLADIQITRAGIGPTTSATMAVVRLFHDRMLPDSLIWTNSYINIDPTYQWSVVV